MKIKTAYNMVLPKEGLNDRADIGQKKKKRIFIPII